MPYISDDERETDWCDGSGRNVGRLNYMITRIIDSWLADRGVDYTGLNAAIGVLECAKLELYRRVAAGYEDKKCAANGDVYTCLEGK
jgi:hypothetical protein